MIPVTQHTNGETKMTTSQISMTLENLIERIQVNSVVTDAEVKAITAEVETATWGGQLGEFGQTLTDRLDLILARTE